MERIQAVTQTMNAMAELARWQHRMRGQPATELLTIMETSALHYIREGATRPTLLAERLYIGPATNTTLIKRLEAGGMLERVPIEGQKRAVSLVLTPRGEAALEEAGAAITAKALAIFDGWRKPELDKFQEFMARLSTAPTV